MVEHRPWLTFLTHAVLIVGCLIIAFPIYVTLVASTHSLEAITSSFPLLPGRQLIENYLRALSVGPRDVGATVGTMMLNSLIMALLHRCFSKTPWTVKTGDGSWQCSAGGVSGFYPWERQGPP